MNRKNSSGSGMFLMEMMVVVCFFILCASVCMLAYAKSDHMSRLAADRNQAVNAAQSMVEVWKLSGKKGLEEVCGAELNPDGFSPSADWAQRLSDSGVDGFSCVAVWDKDWQPCEGAAPPHFIAVFSAASDGDGLWTARVQVLRNRWDAGQLHLQDTEPLFELEAKHYGDSGEEAGA